jgi:Mg2+-importing ATPase
VQRTAERPDLATAARLEPDEVLRRLGSSRDGLSRAEAADRLRTSGPNAVGARRTTAFDILVRQLSNPFLILLVPTAVLALFLGDRSDALIILAIILVSVGLSFVNEYRSERAVADFGSGSATKPSRCATASSPRSPSPIWFRGTSSSWRSARSFRPTCACSTSTSSSATNLRSPASRCLGNVEVLFTDKTGTLTEGQIAFRDALDGSGQPSEDVALLGLVCTGLIVQDGRVVSGNALDRALWEGSAPQRRASAAGYKRIDALPFDFERQMMSVLVEMPDGRRTLICKGAPEAIARRCPALDERTRRQLDAQFDSGNRVVAVATRDATGTSEIRPADEANLEFRGFLAFADEPKADAAASLARLRELGIEVKIVTGDNDRTACAVCRALGMEVGGVLTGAQIAAMDEPQLTAALQAVNVFARVTPEQKARIIRAQRALGRDVGFLGDGVNDAVALHDADVGISVDSAVDVAKDVADIVLLEKDLDILADGVVEGRRIFANTIKYRLMGTSSNFGNMFSAAGASPFLSFLPMLPSQILLNNLLYDGSEMTIPSDNVDEELLQRPAHWDTRFIRRFMAFFGPISSIFDFLTFGVMLFVFKAGPGLFRTGWFVESLATQSLVVFLIRTRRIPFLRSRPSRPLTATTIGMVVLGALLPFTPLAHALGFVPLPPLFFAILMLMIATYLGFIELGKRIFFGGVASAARGRESSIPKRAAP